MRAREPLHGSAESVYPPPLPVIRAFLATWFALLLVCMQNEQYVHAVEHLRAKVELGDQSALQQPDSDYCAECALLAGTGGTIAATPLPQIASPGSWVAATSQVEAPTLPAPASYSSRAPPAAL
jgi:hypothetical protein